MPWKPIAEQYVVANLGGKVRRLLVIAWNSDTGAVKVDWPPQVRSVHRHSPVRKTKIEPSLYEPLEPNGFKSATNR